MNGRMSFIVVGLLMMTRFIIADTFTATVDESRYNVNRTTIGTFRFFPGKKGFVRISNGNTPIDRNVAADAVIFTRTSDGHADTVDNESAEGFYLYGDWNESAWQPNYVGENYLDDYKQGKGQKYAVYMPDLEMEDEYTVVVTHPFHSSVYADAVPVTVKYNITNAVNSLTVINGTGGGSYPYMDMVVITADDPQAGYRFSHWESDNGGHFAVSSSPVTEFIVPDSAVTVTAVFKEESYIRESIRDIPLIASMDAVVVNANLGGIAAAVTLARAGYSVMVTSGTSSFPYEMSAKSRFWLGPDEVPASGTGKDIFGTRSDATGYEFYTPGALKKGIEEYLKDAGVEFLYYTQAIGVLEDGSGTTAGVILANRSGRQAVGARIIIDNTPMAGTARLAGARMTAWEVDSVTVSQVMMFNGPDDEGTFICRYGDQYTPDVGDVREYFLKVPMTTGSWRDRCQAEMRLRGRYYIDYNAAWLAHHLHMVEPNHIVAQATETVWNGVADLDLGVCRPESLSRVYVISSACAVSRAGAEELIRPLNLITLGERVGAEIIGMMDTMATTGLYNIPVENDNSFLSGYDISEALSGHRPFRDYTFVTQAAADVPVWGAEYDVIVVGGGTAGAPAAISAARAGARVLLIEAMGTLGGTGTNGIGTYVRLGYQHGFAMEYGKDRIYSGYSSWRSAEKQQWLFDELRKAGGEVWFNTLGVGVVKSGNQVSGVVAATPMGRAVVMGKKIIDTTGDGDICAWAGAEMAYVNNGDFLLMRSCHSGNDAGASREQQNEYTNIYTDPYSAWSMTHFFAISRQYGKHANQFDFYPHANSRETRRVVGDIVVRSLDIMVGRTYYDMVAVGNGSLLDINGYRNSPAAYSGINNISENIENYFPLRAQVPKGLTGIMVAGRCHSYTHEGIGATRNQADCNNSGYAVGYIAAQAAKQGVAVRDLDLVPVRQHLESIGNMTSSHLADKCVDLADPTDQLLATAADTPDSMNLAWLLYAEDRSIPFLRTSFRNEPTLRKARALCFLGDTAGVTYLAGWLDTTALDADTRYPTYYGKLSMGEVDGAIWALGLTRDERAVPVLLDKLAVCGNTGDVFSHIRALTMALGNIGSTQAALALYDFINRSGVAGNHKTLSSSNADIETNVITSDIELHAAYALYRCGDMNNRAEDILNNYLNDWRTSFARFAAHILQIDTPEVPVDLVDFSVADTDSGIRLNWTTVREQNNKGWNIYRKMGNEPVFSRINGSLIPGNGTTADSSDYDYLDTVPVTQTTKLSYYLEQVDSNDVTYSSYIVSVDIIITGITPRVRTTGRRIEIIQNPYVVTKGDLERSFKNVVLFDLNGNQMSVSSIRRSGPYLIKTGDSIRKVILLVK